MTLDVEERLRAVETQQAVSQAILARMEEDLSNIARSSGAIQEVVTRWKGGIGVLLMVGGSLSAGIAVIVEVIARKLFP
jgi:hypothetical protein